MPRPPYRTYQRAVDAALKEKALDGTLHDLWTVQLTLHRQAFLVVPCAYRNRPEQEAAEYTGRTVTSIRLAYVMDAAGCFHRRA